MLFTGSLNRGVTRGTWLAEHEYVIEDVNKWRSSPASGRLAGATSTPPTASSMRSARHRSHLEYGIGDELRGSVVDADGTYWGAVDCCASGHAWFTWPRMSLPRVAERAGRPADRRTMVSALPSTPSRTSAPGW